MAHTVKQKSSGERWRALSGSKPDTIARSGTTVARLLERLEYTVLQAGTGREALRTLSERAADLDLVILDVVMPELGGVAVFEQVHARHPAIRFLFVTGYSPGTTHFTPLQSLPARVLQNRSRRRPWRRWCA